MSNAATATGEKRSGSGASAPISQPRQSSTAPLATTTIARISPRRVIGAHLRRTVFRSVPTPSTSISTTSPGCMAFVLPGVPV